LSTADGIGLSVPVAAAVAEAVPAVEKLVSSLAAGLTPPARQDAEV
jgi:hypothetical protein